jgi:hypothetical protein
MQNRLIRLLPIDMLVGSLLGVPASADWTRLKAELRTGPTDPRSMVVRGLV